MGGCTPNPTYEETCTGQTGHTETVMVAYDPDRVFHRLIQGVLGEPRPDTVNRQGGDVGTQYRSAIFTTTPAQAPPPRRPRGVPAAAHRGRLRRDHDPDRPAEEAGPFWYAEDYHQGYLHKNPRGYCNHGPNGLTCPVGMANLPAQTDVAPPRH